MTSIPEPCHQPWNDMNPVPGGRHCDSCRKKVVDFTSMSDAQIQRYLAAAGDDICGRLTAGHLGRPLDDAPLQRRRLGLAGLAMTIGLSSVASAQTHSPLAPRTQEQASPTAATDDGRTISGRVVDAAGNPVVKAKIDLKYAKEDDGVLAHCRTDSGGRYFIQVPRYLGGTLLRIRISADDERLYVGPFEHSGSPMLIESRLGQCHDNSPRPALIRGVLQDESGIPVTNGTVELTEAGIVRAREQTDFDGAFSLSYQYRGTETEALVIKASSGARETYLVDIPAKPDTLRLQHAIRFPLIDPVTSAGLIGVTGRMQARKLTAKEKIQRQLHRFTRRIKGQKGLRQ